jgi:hypothetical protein
MSRKPHHAKGVKKKRSQKVLETKGQKPHREDASEDAKGKRTAVDAGPQASQGPDEPQGGVPKRKRRIAPLHAVICTKAARRVVDRMSGPQILEWWRKINWRVFLAESVLGADVTFRGAPMMATAPDSEFSVADQTFRLKQKHVGKRREYLVMLANAPTLGDGAPADSSDDGDGSSGPANGGDNRGKGAEAAAFVDRCIAATTQFEWEFKVVGRVTRRDVNRSVKLAKAKFLSHSRITSDGVQDVWNRVCDHISTAVASFGRASRTIASTYERSKASVIPLQVNDPAQHVSHQASLQAKEYGLLGLRLFSWVWDDTPPIDWSANLFGCFPMVDWSANLFGLLPEEERAFI